MNLKAKYETFSSESSSSQAAYSWDFYIHNYNKLLTCRWIH